MYIYMFHCNVQTTAQVMNEVSIRITGDTFTVLSFQNHIPNDKTVRFMATKFFYVTSVFL